MGFQFALAFAVLLYCIGQATAYSRGMRPGLDYSASLRPRLTGRHFRGAILRTFWAISLPHWLCNAWVRHVDHPWLFSLRVGLVTGVVTAAGTAVTPFIEYYADNLPEKRLGIFGICLLFCGFALQSFQYWLAILDTPVK